MIFVDLSNVLFESIHPSASLSQSMNFDVFVPIWIPMLSTILGPIRYRSMSLQ